MLSGPMLTWTASTGYKKGPVAPNDLCVNFSPKREHASPRHGLPLETPNNNIIVSWSREISETNTYLCSYCDESTLSRPDPHTFGLGGLCLSFAVD